MSVLVAGWSVVVTCGAADAQSPAPASPPPIARAHAHNDYEHSRPLLDALDQGFMSVEADVWLVDGRLLVAHDREALRPDRTLDALYLEPLQARASATAGRIYQSGGEFLLWIDVKSEAEPTYAVLRDVLARYTSMLTVYRGDVRTAGAVTVIVSGNRAREVMAREPLRYAAVDGRLPDLDLDASPSLVPVVSDNWENVFTWRGVGAMADDEREKLGAIVRRAHEQGRTIRFWAIPDTPAGWRVCLDAGVDFINTDDLAGLRAFLRNRVSSDDRRKPGFLVPGFPRAS